MADSIMEIDFFRDEKGGAPCQMHPSPDLDGSPFSGIQKVVSRISPALLKTVMASGVGSPRDHDLRSAGSWGSKSSGKPYASPDSSSCPGKSSWPLPVLVPMSKSSPCGAADTAPLTIFYNGTVAAFNVPRDKAEAIIKMAETGIIDHQEPSRPEDNSSLDGDLPIARKKSLKRFLEKRQERCRGSARAGALHHLSSARDCWSSGPS